MTAIEHYQRQMFRDWLSDGETWIGIFENIDPGHRHFGKRIAISFDDSVYDIAVLGMSAPDMQGVPILGEGSRWRLVFKARNVDDALAAIEGGVH